MTAPAEIWILGATGRVGSGAARDLAAKGFSLVLVGRNEVRLHELERTLPGTRRVLVAGTLEATLAELSRGSAAVVVNTVGPFATTAVPVARACPKGAGYVDVSNELFAVRDVLALNAEAAAARKCLVPGAGWGFLATESVVLKLCQGRPTPREVRVEPIPFVAAGGDQVGEALAATIVDAFAAGMWRYANGELVRASAGSEVVKLLLPDGRRVATAILPTGDLEAAQRASKAPFVVAASPMAPKGLGPRLLVPLISAAAGWRPLRDFAVRRLAAVRTSVARGEPTASWGHARVEWPDGVVREGWLQAGDAMDFTVRATAEVAARLAGSGARPGAFTPGELFGPELAEAAGAGFRIEGGAQT